MKIIFISSLPFFSMYSLFGFPFCDDHQRCE